MGIAKKKNKTPPLLLVLSSDKPKRKRALEGERARGRGHPGGEPFLTGVEMQVKGSMGTPAPLPLARSEDGR